LASASSVSSLSASPRAVPDEGEAGAPRTAVSASPGGWANARLLPATLALAAQEMRRSGAAEAGNLDELKPGADGSVDLALATVIDFTLRRNVDLVVRSYDPALSAEDVAARQAIFDPLL